MKKKYIVIIVCFLLLIIIAGLISKFIYYDISTYHKINDQHITPTPDPLSPINILLLGYGGGKHDGAYLTDTIILFHVEPKSQFATLISIPRDLWVSIPLKNGQETFIKANAAYAIGSSTQNIDRPELFTGFHGGGNLAKYVTENITGLPIQSYIYIDFEGFRTILDQFGTITIDVPNSFDDYFYPIEEKKIDACGKTEEEIKNITATMSGQKLDEQFPCRYEHLHFEKGIQEMDAETALKFVRSRKSLTENGDFGRVKRQQALIVAIKKKFLRIGSIPKIISMIRTMITYVTTDIDITTALHILETREKILESSIHTIVLDENNVLEESRSEDGQSILIPKGGINNWNVIHDYISNSLNRVSTSSASLDVIR